MNIEADDLLVSANITALNALEALENRTSLIDNITTVSRNSQQELEAFNNSVDGLQLQLERALQAAASVSACSTLISVTCILVYF